MYCTSGAVLYSRYCTVLDSRYCTKLYTRYCTVLYSRGCTLLQLLACTPDGTAFQVLYCTPGTLLYSSPALYSRLNIVKLLIWTRLHQVCAILCLSHISKLYTSPKGKTDRFDIVKLPGPCKLKHQPYCTPRYCTVLYDVLYFTPGTVLYSMYCTILHVLYCTVLQVLYCIVFQVLSCIHCTVLAVLHVLSCTSGTVLNSR